MWFLYKGVTLTKDNLAKKGWQGNVKCCFCNLRETIQHLFFSCHWAKLIWRIFSIAFNINPPNNIQHVFTDWLATTPLKQKRLIWSGISALCWALWLSRNNVVFDNQQVPSCLQVISRATYWARTWSLLLNDEDRLKTKTTCRVLEFVGMEVFANNGWRFNNRIAN